MADVMLDETKSHHTGGPFGASGSDAWPVELAADRQFDRVELEILHADRGCGARMDSTPEPGATRRVEPVVRWWHGGFGKVRYRIKVFAKALPPASDDDRVIRVFDSDLRTHGPLFPFGASGIDEDVAIELPPGYGLLNAEIITRERKRATAMFRKPLVHAGSAGRLSFNVLWEVQRLGGGTLRYLVRATAANPGPFLVSAGPPVIAPDPPRAGAEVTLTVRVTNEGATALTDVAVTAGLYAKSLDQAPDSILDLLSDDQRSQTHAGNPLPTLDPGGSADVSLVRRLPATYPLQNVIPQFPDGPSAAGHYRLTVGVIVRPAGGRSIGVHSQVIDDIRIERAL